MTFSEKCASYYYIIFYTHFDDIVSIIARSFGVSLNISKTRYLLYLFVHHPSVKISITKRFTFSLTLLIIIMSDWYWNNRRSSSDLLNDAAIARRTTCLDVVYVCVSLNPNFIILSRACFVSVTGFALLEYIKNVIQFLALILGPASSHISTQCCEISL